MKLTLNIIVIAFIFPFTILYAQDDVVESRIKEIARTMDTSIFVSRLLSIETPCLCIDEKDSSVAFPKRTIINSNYRIKLTKDETIDSSGVKCLSEHIARYVDFQIKCINVEDQTISGDLEITYAYPASSLIQFLGYTIDVPDKNRAYFKKLVSSRGTFKLYPEGDKYRIKMVISDPPFDARDTYFGYLEVVKHAFEEKAGKVYILNFDQMSIYKGDANNQIEVKFTSTTHANETKYYAALAYEVLKRMNSADLYERAKAIWLDNFLKNPQCKQCMLVYKLALDMISKHTFSLPNTSPIPAH